MFGITNSITTFVRQLRHKNNIIKMTREVNRLTNLKHTVKTALGQLVFENRKEIRDFEKIKKIELIVETKTKELSDLEEKIVPFFSNKAKLELVEILENKRYDYLDNLFLDTDTIKRIKDNCGELIFSKDGYKFIVKNYSVIKVLK